MITNKADSLVYVIDDDRSVCKAIELMVKSSGYRCRTFSDGMAFFRNFDFSIPGCVVLDIRMPTISGLEVHRRLGKASFSIPIIMVSGVGDVALAVEAMRSGAYDLITKPIGLARLRESVDNAIKLDLARRRQDEARKSVRERIEKLTAKENVVLEMILQGMINKQIAAKLKVSLRTDERRRANILQKMGVDTLCQLVPLLLGVAHRTEPVSPLKAESVPHFTLSRQNELN